MIFLLFVCKKLPDWPFIDIKLYIGTIPSGGLAVDWRLPLWGGFFREFGYNRGRDFLHRLQIRRWPWHRGDGHESFHWTYINYNYHKCGHRDLSHSKVLFRNNAKGAACKSKACFMFEIEILEAWNINTRPEAKTLSVIYL